MKPSFLKFIRAILLTTGLLGLGLTGASAQAAFNQVMGLEQIQADLVADSPFQFSHVLNSEWPISYLGAEEVTLRVLPAGTFQVRDSGTGRNQFIAKLVSTAGLKTPFGAVVPLSVEILGRGEGGGAATDEIGVQFIADDGTPIDLEVLARDPQVRNFQVQAQPADFVTQTRVAGSRVFYRRARGYGNQSVQVVLAFTYAGMPFRYTADLPTRDDGYIAQKSDYSFNALIHGSDLDIYSQRFYASSQSDIDQQYKNYIRSTLYSACNRATESVAGNEYACRQRAIRMGYAKEEEILTVSAHAEECNSSDIQEVFVGSNVCLYSERRGEGTCFSSGLTIMDKGYIRRRISCSITTLRPQGK